MLHSQAAYRLDFWVRSLAMILSAYAVSSVWFALYEKSPNAFGVSQSQMVTYGAMAMFLWPVLGAAGEVQYRIADQVRLGLIELDLLKPLNFIKHMLFLNVGEGMLQLMFRSLLGYLFGLIFLGVAPPHNLPSTFLFLLSLVLGYLIFFFISFLVGMLAIVSIEIHGFSWMFESISDLASGQLVPIWVFPAPIVAVLSALPFKDIFFAPLTIYIGAADVWQTFASQVFWLAALAFISQTIWARIQRRLVVQGG
jgi:ABC-2 type transport system permease protein